MGSNPCPQAGSTLKAVKRKFLGRYRVQAAFDGDLYVFPVVGKSCIPAFGPQGYFTVHHPSGKIAAENSVKFRIRIHVPNPLHLLLSRQKPEGYKRFVLASRNMPGTVMRKAYRFGGRIKEKAMFYRLSVYRSEEHTSELQSLMRISYAV